jgi:hypothetical protein
MQQLSDGIVFVERPNIHLIPRLHRPAMGKKVSCHFVFIHTQSGPIIKKALRKGMIPDKSRLREPKFLTTIVADAPLAAFIVTNLTNYSRGSGF